MNTSARIFIGYFLLIGLSSLLLINVFLNEVRPSILQSVEELMVDVSHLLAESIEEDLSNGSIDTEAFARQIDQYANRTFNAKIYKLTKRQTAMDVYITNQQGIVVFDSRKQALGLDYSNKNDVYLTLQGKYGARISNDNDTLDKVMYVAAPIVYNEAIIGAVTVIKANTTSNLFIDAGKKNIVQQGAILIICSLLIGLVLSWWFSRSIRKLSQFADELSQGKRISAPKLREPQLAKLGQAMESMRGKLEGKNNVEHYMHTFTHEMKSPLAAIKGAAEILQEDIPQVDKQRFVTNILNESHRMQQVVDQLLQLATVENYKMLNNKKPVNVSHFIEAILINKETLLSEKNIRAINSLSPKLSVLGDHFLLSQAINNLVDNAIEFTPTDGTIHVRNTIEPNFLAIIIEDSGTGIPPYASDKIFDRFYSLTRPSSKHKSSGLGLSFVKEVASLHGGTISVINNDNGSGTIATLRLPYEP